MESRFLVSPAEYDDIGAMLRELGGGFAFDECGWQELCQPSTLKRYDVVYLNCSGQLINQSYLKKLAKPLRGYVEEGGTVYASDWALHAICKAFPNELEIDSDGDKGDIECAIVDRGLKEILGGDIKIHFDLPQWVQLKNTANDVRTYVEAQNLHPPGRPSAQLPIVVGFRHGAGHVLATSFHNERQLSERERRLLRFLALQPVLANTASQSTAALDGKDCELGAEIMETIDPGQTSAPLYFESDGRPLLFFLNWTGTARLELQVSGPDDRVRLKREANNAPIGGEITNGEAGRWKCHVRGVDVPFQNFPFVLTIAAANAPSVKAPPPPPPPKNKAAVPQPCAVVQQNRPVTSAGRVGPPPPPPPSRKG